MGSPRGTQVDDDTRPQWLADAHTGLDAAVAAAYGWDEDILEGDALETLLELNQKF